MPKPVEKALIDKIPGFLEDDFGRIGTDVEIRSGRNPWHD
jgi:hypothetical protein